MEKTLIIFKPDCIEKRCVGKVISRFEQAQFEIRASKVLTLSNDLLLEHYAHIKDLPFFPEISEFMSSCPVIVMVLEGDNIVARVRDLLGPTDSQTAPEGTIRGDLGTDKMRNICHASDSVENAEIEIARFFKSEIS